mgnify:CR=1 FL=1
MLLARLTYDFSTEQSTISTLVLASTGCYVGFLLKPKIFMKNTLVESVGIILFKHEVNVQEFDSSGLTIFIEVPFSSTAVISYFSNPQAGISGLVEINGKNSNGSKLLSNKKPGLYFGAIKTGEMSGHFTFPLIIPVSINISLTYRVAFALKLKLPSLELSI